MGYEDPVQLADLLHRLTRRLRSVQAERLGPLGLTPAQERALRLITRDDKPLRMTELADRLGIVPRSLTTVVDALEQAGLVRREIDPRNRRAILLRLTDRGAAVRDDLRGARRRAAEELFAPLTAGDREALADLLSRLDTPHDKAAVPPGGAPTRSAGWSLSFPLTIAPDFGPFTVPAGRAQALGAHDHEDFSRSVELSAYSGVNST